MSIWNLLDYPSVIIPTSQVNSKDLKDLQYEPISERDKKNFEIYDPSLFAEAPVSLQLVGRNLQEEKLLAVAMAVDQAIGKASIGPAG